MAHSPRASTYTTDSSQETGIVPANKSIGTVEGIEQYEGLHDIQDQAVNGHQASADTKSYHEVSKDEGLRNGTGFYADDPDSHHSTTSRPGTEKGYSVTCEMPKKVSTRRRRWALYYILRFHVPSLVITLFLVALYCRNWIWQPPGPSPEMLNALQFAAKIHEGLIVLSLTNIVLHRLRFLLLHGQGVPLGLLTSPFQLSSPLYLVSLEFWGAIKSSLNSLTGIATVSLLLVSLALAMAIGPFSAIVMLPSYGLWAVPSSFPGMSGWHNWMALPENKYFETVKAVRPGDLYPAQFGPGLGVNWSCPDRATYGDKAYGCRTYINKYFPAVIEQSADLVNTASWVDYGNTLSQYGEYIQAMGMANISSLLSDGTVWLASNEPYTPVPDGWVVNAVALATTPLMITTEVTILQWQILVDHFTNATILKRPEFFMPGTDGAPVMVKQPVVITHCAGTQFLRENFTESTQFIFSIGLFPTFNLTVGETLATLLWNSSHSHKESFMVYVDMGQSIPYPTSTVAIAVNNHYDNDGNLSENKGIQICLVSARWAEADAWGKAHEAWGVLKQDPVTLVNHTQHVDAAEIIDIDANWMMELDYSPYTYYTAKEMLGDDAVSDYDFFAAYCADQPHCLSIGISSMLATALSTTQCAYTECAIYGFNTPDYNFTHLRTDEEAVAAGDALRVKTGFWIYTYGYGVRDSWLTFAGLSVLLFHALVVVVHVGLILGRGFWTSDAWGSLGELVALALRSSPPSLLTNATAGVSKMSTWQLVAVVREKTSEDRLELVIRERGGLPPATAQTDIEKGVNNRAELHGDLSPPRSDKKYG